jgi:hypothetical protein
MCRTGSSTELGRIIFTTSDTFDFWDRNSSGTQVFRLTTTQVFRDPSAWYHIVIAVDTTQATAANRVIMYVNGVQVTAFSTASYPSQNANLDFNTTATTLIGGETASGTYFDGYMTEINFVNAQQLTPSSFGSFNALTGVWQPTQYTGAYGTNGYELQFTDNSALTTSSNVGLGKDFSGNGNYFATNNISITAGVTYDSMTDVPTLTSATAANYCVWNPLDTGSTSMTASNANLTFAKSGANFSPIRGTIAVTSGKYYFEMFAVNSSLTQIGVSNGYNIRQSSGNNSLTASGANGAAWDSRGYLYYPSGGGSYAYTFTTNDVVMVAFDASTGKIWFGKNGTWNTGDPAAGTSPAYTASGYDYLTPFGNGESGGSGSANFGQRPFAYTPPTGFVALNTFNLPTSTIVKGSDYMNAGLYTGTGSATALPVAGPPTPDFVWIKSRSAASSNSLLDDLRSTSTPFSLRLYSNTTGSEYNYGSSLLTPTSTGFNLTTTDGDHNTNGATYVAWQWQAGKGSYSTNTNGSITSTVSVNASAGFSVVTFTAPNAASPQTFGHGLGVAPAFFTIKGRNATTSWQTYHSSIGATNRLLLNTTDAQTTTSGPWNNTAPTSTVITIGGSFVPDAGATTYVAYCWTPIAGYSSFGSYTGNGSSDGPFVYTGFRPKFVMFKRYDSTGAWCVFDTSRNTYNTADLELNPNSSAAENSGNALDMLSNGFKWRDTFGSHNATGGLYVYAAFAENPFKNALAR